MTSLNALGGVTAGLSPHFLVGWRRPNSLFPAPLDCRSAELKRHHLTHPARHVSPRNEVAGPDSLSTRPVFPALRSRSCSQAPGPGKPCRPPIPPIPRRWWDEVLALGSEVPVNPAECRNDPEPRSGGRPASSGCHRCQTERSRRPSLSPCAFNVRSSVSVQNHAGAASSPGVSLHRSPSPLPPSAPDAAFAPQLLTL